MAAVMLGHNVVASGVSCGASTPSGWESCVRVSLGRPGGGAAALPCSSGRRISAEPSVRWGVRGAVKELSASLPTQRLCCGGADDDQTPLSKFESLLGEKSQEVAHEVALCSQRGISIYLIGMMASGKSTVGREVAKALEYGFFDRYEAI